MMGKEQKEIHYCSIQFNNINLCVLYCTTKERYLLSFSFYNDKLLFQIKYQTLKNKEEKNKLNGR
jgi:hypothetical protein